MRIIICGTRSLTVTRGKKLIAQALKETGWEANEIIEGGASGGDAAAKEYAKENGIDSVQFPANWKGKNKRAGFLRNQKMAWYAAVAEQILLLQDKEVPDRFKPGCIALWNGTSKGTQHMIDIAKEKDIPVKIMLYRPQIESS